MENEKHVLTDKLKGIETAIYEKKIDLSSVRSKLEIAQQYEEYLIARMQKAKERTEVLRREFFSKSGEISEEYEKMKKIFDVFTGNFYNNIEV